MTKLAPGIWSMMNVVKTFGSEHFLLLRDKRLEKHGIVVDSGGLLIDQPATETLIGGPIGSLPEEYLASLRDGTTEMSIRDGTVIIPTPDHWGWQYGCAHLYRGKAIKLPGDPILFDNSTIETLCYSSTFGWGWGEYVLSLPCSLDPVNFEFTATMIVREGQITALDELVEHPRLQADARNLFVFNDNKQVPSQFFQLIRPLLPTDAETLRAMLRGERVVIKRKGISDHTYAGLRYVIEQCQLHHLCLQRIGSLTQLTVNKPLPRMRMPLTGVGLDHDYRFMAVTIDGRQEGSAGATVEELAKIMLEEGAMFASLGGGGGDTYIGEVENGVLVNKNVPSNIDPVTKLPGARRRSPNALVIVPAPDRS